jgi:hypothetical protein
VESALLTRLLTINRAIRVQTAETTTTTFFELFPFRQLLNHCACGYHESLCSNHTIEGLVRNPCMLHGRHDGYLDSKCEMANAITPRVKLGRNPSLLCFLRAIRI